MFIHSKSFISMPKSYSGTNFFIKKLFLILFSLNVSIFLYNISVEFFCSFFLVFSFCLVYIYFGGIFVLLCFSAISLYIVKQHSLVNQTPKILCFCYVMKCNSILIKKMYFKLYFMILKSQINLQHFIWSYSLTVPLHGMFFPPISTRCSPSLPSGLCWTANFTAFLAYPV